MAASEAGNRACDHWGQKNHMIENACRSSDCTDVASNPFGSHPNFIWGGRYLVSASVGIRAASAGLSGHFTCERSAANHSSKPGETRSIDQSAVVFCATELCTESACASRVVDDWPHDATIRTSSRQSSSPGITAKPLGRSQTRHLPVEPTLDRPCVCVCVNRSFDPGHLGHFLATQSPG